MKLDDRRFDALIRRFAAGHGETRRGLLGKLSLGAFGAALATVGFGPLAEEDAEAARSRKKCRKRCKRRFKDNRRKKRKCLRRCKRRRTPGGCTTDAQCKGSRVCAGNRCVNAAACTSDEQCGAGRVCNNTGDCVDDTTTTCTVLTDCGVGQICNPVTQTCQTTASPCTPGGCGTDEVCLTALNICLTTGAVCTDPSDCTAGEICVGGFCVTFPSGQCDVIGSNCDTAADDCCEGLVCLDLNEDPAQSLCVGL